MATFDQNEHRIETGDVSLAVTISGGGQVWRYTNSDGSLTDADGAVYEPAPLATGNLKSDTGIGDGELEVSLPRSLPLADRFFPEADTTTYRIVIRQAHHNDGEVIEAPLVFVGIILTAASSGDGAELKLKCSTQMGLLNRSGLQRRYQHQCPFVLYGSQCRASKAASQIQATINAPVVKSFSDVEVFFYGEDADDPKMWRGRDLSKPENRIFMVGATITFQGTDYGVWDIETVNTNPNMIRVRLRPDQVDALRAAVAAADPADRVCVITPSCDHTVPCCQQVHSNGPNFGGQPWIPYENPVHTKFVGV